MLNTLLIFPAIKVRLSGSKMKSLPSIKMITSYDTVLYTLMHNIYITHTRICIYIRNDCTYIANSNVTLCMGRAKGTTGQQI